MWASWQDYFNALYLIYKINYGKNNKILFKFKRLMFWFFVILKQSRLNAVFLFFKNLLTFAESRGRFSIDVNDYYEYPIAIWQLNRRVNERQNY